MNREVAVLSPGVVIALLLCSCTSTTTIVREPEHPTLPPPDPRISAPQ